jgi:hypothetical protein
MLAWLPRSTAFLRMASARLNAEVAPGEAGRLIRVRPLAFPFNTGLGMDRMLNRL